MIRVLLADDQVRSDLFRLIGTRWERVPQAGDTPGPRADSGMAATFDFHTGRFFMYAGMDHSARDELWAFDGKAWAQLCDGCTGRPRWTATLVYDPGSGRVVLTGGYTGGDEIAGTWEFDGQAFQVTDPRHPDERDTCGVAYAADRDRIVLFGGNGDACDGPGEHCDETFEFVPIR